MLPRTWDGIFRKVFEGLGRRIPSLGESGLLKVALRLGLESPGHLVEDVDRLVVDGGRKAQHWGSLELTLGQPVAPSIGVSGRACGPPPPMGVPAVDALTLRRKDVAAVSEAIEGGRMGALGQAVAFRGLESNQSIDQHPRPRG